MTSHIEDDLPVHGVAETLANLTVAPSTHPPRILILYGSLREELQPLPRRGVRRVLARVRRRGADVRSARPAGVRSARRSTSPKVQELRELSDLVRGARLGLARAARRR